MAANATANDFLYSTTQIMEAMKTRIPVPVFLRDRMFGVTETTIANQVLCDFWMGDTKLAPFCARHKVGIAVDRFRYRSSVFEPALIRPMINLSADDLYYRLPGESFSGTSGASREATLLSE